jgi:hypothetical protein
MATRKSATVTDYGLLRCVTVDGTYHKGDGHRRTTHPVSHALQHFRKSCWLKRHLPIPHDYFHKLQLASYKTRSPGRRKRPFNSFTLSQDNEINEKKQPWPTRESKKAIPPSQRNIETMRTTVPAHNTTTNFRQKVEPFF